jgi:3alpha(or 20beta)-hydroxysteroid dehydrogenase
MKDTVQGASYWSGRSAVVTGAAGGMGSVEALRLLAAGATVHAVDALGPGHAAWTTLAKQAGTAVTRLRHHTADVRDPESWARIGAEAAKDGPVHGLVNNAGITLRSTLTETSPGDWDRVLGINLTGSFLGIQAIAPMMADGGSIVNISSSAGLTGYFGTAYSVSKWGVRGLTKSAAMELSPRRIRVNTVCPGLVDSAMTRNPNAIYSAAQAETFYEECRQSTLFGRGAAMDEVADTVMFLLGPHSAYITGADIPVDGGMVDASIYARVGRAAGSLDPV